MGRRKVIENDEKPEGDEIFNRLVFIDDTAAPRAPQAGEACHAGLVPLEACSLALVTLRLVQRAEATRLFGRA